MGAKKVELEIVISDPAILDGRILEITERNACKKEV